MDLKQLNKINDWLWEIPRSFRGDMLVPARIYASEKLLEQIFLDRSIGQLINTTTLPGIQKYSIVMPDAHEGYGFPIGGVAATSYPDGSISPGGIGYDINCGVRLLRSEITFEEIKPQLDKLSLCLFQEIPCGVGVGGKLKLNDHDMDRVLKNGVKWVIEKGFGEHGDMEHIESNGSLSDADPADVSSHAKDRGRDQLGTMGAGNHFVEVDRVEEIFDERTALEFGIFKDQIVILVHTGSRGLGHQVATDHIKIMLRSMTTKLPDPELACMPFSSDEGASYFRAMSAAANFAWANRQMIGHEVQTAWQKTLGNSGGRLTTLYDVAHNIAKMEEHENQKLIVHRKGATRAFDRQPVIIPGSMGTASYVLVGTSQNSAFGSTCHGAGRRMSRHAAIKKVNTKELMRSLKEKGIQVQSRSLRGLAEEAPEAYKDVDEVVNVVHNASLARKVCRLKPLAIVKG